MKAHPVIAVGHHIRPTALLKSNRAQFQSVNASIAARQTRAKRWPALVSNGICEWHRATPRAKLAALSAIIQKVRQKQQS